MSGDEPLGQIAQALAAACLTARGDLTGEQTAALANIAVELRRRIRTATARGDSNAHFQATTVLRVVDLIAAAAKPPPSGGQANR